MGYVTGGISSCLCISTKTKERIRVKFGPGGAHEGAHQGEMTCLIKILKFDIKNTNSQKIYYAAFALAFVATTCQVDYNTSANIE